MRLKALLAAAMLAAAAQGAALAADPADLLGHYAGTMLTREGVKSDAELTLDRYKCFVLSVKKDQGGLETGFYDVKDDLIILMKKDRTPYRWFFVTPGERLEERGAEGSALQNPPDGCCLLRHIG